MRGKTTDEGAFSYVLKCESGRSGADTRPQAGVQAAQPPKGGAWRGADRNDRAGLIYRPISLLSKKEKSIRV